MKPYEAELLHLLHDCTYTGWAKFSYCLSLFTCSDGRYP